MSSVVNVLSWAAIACAAAGVVVSLVMLATERPAARIAPSTSWQTVRTGCGVIRPLFSRLLGLTDARAGALVRATR
jgi:hypothetical protein